MSHLNAWFELGRRLASSQINYGRLAIEALDATDFPKAALYRGIAEGLKHARHLMNDIAAETRETAVGWTTNPDPAAAETPSLET